ncbi:MAG TPA: helix-turn-helix domain-containing protein [Firmicutes bacterium]|nr:helix-turn-helix domain-containing protein [Bacillota bacterium]
MYKNRSRDGKLNICGQKVKSMRKALGADVSQKVFADMLVLAGLDLDKNAIQRIESGKRFVTDIELKTIAQVLHTTTDELLKD